MCVSLCISMFSFGVQHDVVCCMSMFAFVVQHEVAWVVHECLLLFIVLVMVLFIYVYRCFRLQFSMMVCVV